MFWGEVRINYIRSGEILIFIEISLDFSKAIYHSDASTPITPDTLRAPKLDGGVGRVVGIGLNNKFTYEKLHSIHRSFVIHPKPTFQTCPQACLLLLLLLLEDGGRVVGKGEADVLHLP